MLVKIYGEESKGQKRYSPAKFVSAEKRVMAGNPDASHISTSYVERNNLTMRMGMVSLQSFHLNMVVEFHYSA